MAVIHVHSDEEYAQLKASAPLLVLDLSARWCGPCRGIAPLYEDLASKNPSITFAHVDIDELGHLEDAQVRGVPTFKFFVQGQQVYEFSGANRQELISSVQRLSRVTLSNDRDDSNAQPIVIHPENDSHYEQLKRSSHAVAQYSAEFCQPCRTIAPYLAQLATENPQITFIHVDVEQFGQLPDVQDVTSLPTFKFFHRGQLVEQFSGANAARLASTVESLATLS
jgi:thioredoxin 1